jgi:LCP family protein required for cell wall assembly
VDHTPSTDERRRPAPPGPVALTGGAATERDADHGPRIRRLRRLLLWGLPVLTAAGAAGAALAGRDAAGNALAALRLAGLSGRVPGWVLPVTLAAAVAAAALVVAYLALGRRRPLKALLLATVAVALGVPGIAVGYANGTIDVVSAGTPEQAAAIEAVEKELDRPLPDKAVTILLIGSDKSFAGDPGRSDTQLLVRLDPDTKSISMLSLPRDLLVDIPGHGKDKMNAAYAYGGPRLVVKTFKQLTGLQINHFIQVDFSGFWHVVNLLGGVYLPVDHRYYVPESADYKSIDLQPGYQLVRGKQALNFVRYRHDAYGDFTRMQRQQLFLRELQRQSGRWSGDWRKVVRLIRAIAHETSSDLDSLRRLEPLVELAFRVDTSRVYAVHVEGSTPTIDGVSYVTASPGTIAEAVGRFTDPEQAPLKKSAAAIPRRSYRVTVHGADEAAVRRTAAGLRARGYTVVASAGGAAAAADGTTGRATVVYAPRALKTQATLLGAMLWPSDVQVVRRAPGTLDGIEVFLGSEATGEVGMPAAASESSGISLQPDVREGWSSWKQLAAGTSLRLQAPTAWATGSTWSQFRSYTVKTTEGRRVAAAVAVAETSGYGSWSVQALRWTDPPAVAHPTATQTVGGRAYRLFYQGSHLHMVAWTERGTLYWVVNTLDDQLPNDVILGLATSCRPVR